MKHTEIKYDKIGVRLKDLRKAKGYSQNGLAIRAGVNWETIKRCEAGRSNLSLMTAVRICDALNITLDYFVGR